MKTLNKLYFLKIEINELKDEIENLTELSASAVSGMPHSSSLSNPTENYLFKKQKLIEKLNKKLDRYFDELIRIENIIDDIDDPETRIIARMRYVENLKWADIGKKVNMDRSVCSRKLKKYFGEYYGKK